jgi:tetratricopeptide (TPR) repeat protein
MSRGRDDVQRAAEILSVIPDFDSSRLVLSPEEGFLLSRIDGVTPWRLLVEMSGVDAAHAEQCLDAWLVAGAIETVAGADSNSVRLDTSPTAPTAPTEHPTECRDAAGIDLSRVDPSLEIDVKTQKRILEFEARQGGGYHHRLGIDPGADIRTIKKAYFKLSREFHPDRFFRCDLGPYSERLPLIFKTILEAYDALLRACPGDSAESGSGMGRREGDSPRDGAPLNESQTLDRSKFEKISRLGQRTLHNVPRSVRDERHQKAEGFFEASRLSEREGRLEEASTSLRLAIRFEPENLVYRSALKDLKNRKGKLSVHDVLDASKFYLSMNPDELGRTMKALEKVLELRPQDSELNHRAACVALALNQLNRARRLAEIALEQSPEVVHYHTTLGRIYLAQGHTGHAKREFELVLEFSPQDADARRELANLLRSGREAYAGGSRG